MNKPITFKHLCGLIVFICSTTVVVAVGHMLHQSVYQDGYNDGFGAGSMTYQISSYNDTEKINGVLYGWDNATTIDIVPNCDFPHACIYDHFTGRATQITEIN